ncbi:hypothetical protein MTO96_015285 [Rhipicephalus appendiculatus]
MPAADRGRQRSSITAAPRKSFWARPGIIKADEITRKAADEMLSLAASHCRVGFVESLRSTKETEVAIIELPAAVMSAHGDLPAAGDVVLPGSGGSSERLDAKDEPEKTESLCVTCAQVFLPFLLAGMGSVAASLLLDHVKDWPVYSAYRELFVLIPPLLGLNGNLEMTLVARMSTQVRHQLARRSRSVVVKILLDREAC